MTSPGDTSGDGGQQGSGTGTGTAPDTTGQQTGQGSSGTGQSPPADAWADADAWRDFATTSGLTVEAARKAIEHAREWERRSKANAAAAQANQTLQQQVDEMRKTLAERDTADIDRELRTARKTLRAELIELGIDGRDADDALELVDLSRVLKDNVADDKLISETAKRLAKVAGRATPDRDQGQGGTGQAGQQGAGGMDAWVHQRVNAARRR
jgi:hypothetical protein